MLKNNKKIFITGTNTGVGKTYVTVGLLKILNQLGYSTLGIKPLASGCQLVNNQLFNDDALALQQFSSIKLNYSLINPFAFAPPIAPHIAAAQVNVALSTSRLIAKTNAALNQPADFHFIEGVGGWHVPLNNTETMADFVIQRKFPVLLVVGINLGCLNHAILTYLAIQSMQAPIVGWIANFFEPAKSESMEIIATLKHKLKIPYLGITHYQHAFDIDVSALTSF